jgi:hypothetical protein
MLGVHEAGLRETQVLGVLASEVGNENSSESKACLT